MRRGIAVALFFAIGVLKTNPTSYAVMGKVDKSGKNKYNCFDYGLAEGAKGSMKNSNRHNRILNRLLVLLIAPFLCLIFRYRYEKRRLSGPTLIICNHVTNYDPLLLSACFPWDHTHYVASEHLFRLGWIGKFLKYVFDPIPRRKGTSGADTAMACLRKLRAGRSVTLFAEGECTWDGVTADIVPSTGRLAKMSGATLMTCRMDGGYLTAPRWGKGIRPGKMTCRVVGVYTPEELKQLDGPQIEDLIRRDIHSDIWADQRRQKVAYRSRRRAENLQTVLYLCPRCKKTGTLSSKGKTLFCGCGARWEFTPFGTFAPAEPFEDIVAWDTWQRQELGGQSDVVMRDEAVTVFRIEADHKQTALQTAPLTLEKGVLRCGELAWELSRIDDLALVMSRNLLMSVGKDYYQLKAPKGTSLRKYRVAWHAARSKENCEV